MEDRGRWHAPRTSQGRRLLLDDGIGQRELDVDGRTGLEELAAHWTRATWSNGLFKEVRWLGMPMQQLAEDVVMLQEVCWDVQPDVVVETGVADGGSAIFWASMIELVGGREVVSVDIRVRPEVAAAIGRHPLGHRVALIEGDAVAADVVERVRSRVRPDDRVLVVLDSDHSRDHVMAELDAYAPLVTPGSYVVVTDGVMQVLDDAPKGDPSWSQDNPLAAANGWLAGRDGFTRDLDRERLLATYLPGAWLRREGVPPPRPPRRTAWGEQVAALHRERRELRKDLAASEAARALAEQDLEKAFASTTWRVGRSLVQPVGTLLRRAQGRPVPANVQERRGRAVPAPSPLSSASRRRLDLLRHVLTDSLHGDPYRPYVPDRGTRAYARWMELRDELPHGNVELVRRVGFDLAKRAVGKDWPSRAETMVGLARLQNVQDCIESVHVDGVPGDIVEAGVWRGGTAIFMRAVLEELGIVDRVVWACDSFRGLPAPDVERWPQEEGDRHHLREELAVGVDEVRANFERYGLLDDQVRFAEGWFEDTLPHLPVDEIAVLRLDGDMYGSTMVALESLEPRVPIGGMIIIDDYGAIEQCRQAVHDYRDARDISAPIQRVDWTGAFWRKA